jgi:ferritin-like protein
VAALLKQVKTETGSIKAVVEIESLAQFTYFTAVGQLRDPRLVRLAAEILASESQHWTLLAALVHKGRPEASVPHPFVRGSQQLTPL